MLNIKNRGQEKLTLEMGAKRKFKVSSGYLLEFDQLARVLNFLFESKAATNISREELLANTGLSNRQIESIVSIGRAVGLIKPHRQILSPIGILIAEHDIFFDNRGTLEWCHYVGAGSYQNLIWFEIFNHLLPEASPMTQEEWNDRFRSDLAGKYSKRTISKGLYEEKKSMFWSINNHANFNDSPLRINTINKHTKTSSFYKKQ